MSQNFWLANMYSTVEGITVVDSMLKCVAATGSTDCRGLYSLEWSNLESFAFVAPILTKDNSTDVVGFVYALGVWSELLEDIVPDFVEGVDVVVSRGGEQLTFTVDKGEVRTRGVGDQHDRRYSSYGKYISLCNETALMSCYREHGIHVYPAHSFVVQYSTSTPLLTSIGVICSILAISIIFFGYDYLMSREVIAKQVMLDTRKKFVRFISHEMRTVSLLM